MKIVISAKFRTTASAAHGVLRLIIEMNGERYKTATRIWPITSWNEKLIESKNILQACRIWTV